MMSPLNDSRPTTVFGLDVEMTSRFMAEVGDEASGKTRRRKRKTLWNPLAESDKKENNFIGLIGNDMGLLSGRLKTGSELFASGVIWESFETLHGAFVGLWPFSAEHKGKQNVRVEQQMNEKFF